MIIEYNDKVFIQICGIVQRFVSHSARQRAVADHRYDSKILSLKLPGPHKSQPRRNGSGTVPRIEGIAVTFLPFGKSAETVCFPQRGKLVFSAGENLMGVRLMAHIPDQLVLGKIQHPVQRYGQLHHSQVRRQMAAGFT